MGMAAMLVMWPSPFEQFFFPKVHGGFIWNLVAIGSGVTEEKSFEIVDGRTDGRRTDGRTTEPAYTISSPGAFGSGELKSLTRRLWIYQLYVLANLGLLIYKLSAILNIFSLRWRTGYVVTISYLE